MPKIQVDGTLKTVCGDVPQEWIGSQWNSEYNSWFDECVRKIVSQYGSKEAEEKVKELTRRNQELEKEKKSQFSTGTATGIGASAAAGGIALGAGGVTLVPMLIRGIMKLFV